MQPERLISRGKRGFTGHALGLPPQEDSDRGNEYNRAVSDDGSPGRRTGRRR
ncbi:hypothetical protein FTUN_2173 [Frigoriglobus tundricola]|uniref:Uncharacterized protein n=1 Tax=Frigoriglobus tundricola TaxID=2774151 RepID=A0A6M5YN39_9BACT|nr:hypothetical protein FTUN_2173 [Frigoriglobus tundricola]